MLDSKDVIASLYKNEIKFASGVPDSLLSVFCGELLKNVGITHITAANEGNAVALACGYNLATGKIPLIYMQNSGIGNAVNPLLSLSDKNVYNIPALYVIGYRGEPSVKDEPQHVTQGKLTEPLLNTLGIEYQIISPETNQQEFDRILREGLNYINKRGENFAFLVRKGSFCAPSCAVSDVLPDNGVEASSIVKMTRRDAVNAVIRALPKNSVVISTTGKTSRELYEIRNESNQGHFKDFLTVGSMGHASQIALSVSIFKKDTLVYCIDGEGALLMHMGAMAVNGGLGGKNFIHVLINNGSHDSVGGQPNFGKGLDFSQIAANCGYSHCYRVYTEKEIYNALTAERKGAAFLQIDVGLGSDENLSRPKESPVENKKQFIKYLKDLGD